MQLLPSDDVMSYVHAPFITGKGALGWGQYSDVGGQPECNTQAICARPISL